MIVFVDHQLGERNGDMRNAIKHADNMSSVLGWVRFLTKVTPWAIEASWYAQVAAVVPQHRRLVDSVRILERCDLYAMCGGVVSPHMHHNLRAARRAGVPVLDLTMYGVLPPEATEEARLSIAARVEKFVERSPCCVWLPLLTPADIRHLKRAHHELEARTPDINKDALAILKRIIDAAEQHRKG